MYEYTSIFFLKKERITDRISGIVTVAREYGYCLVSRYFVTLYECFMRLCNTGGRQFGCVSLVTQILCPKCVPLVPIVNDTTLFGLVALSLAL